MDVWLILMIILIVVVVALFVLLKYLSRDPHRAISSYDNVVSPSDGRIIEIIPYDHADQIIIQRTVSKVIAHAEHISKKGHMITIFTNWNNIHYNRMPITGTIHSYKKVEGKNFSVRDPEAVLSNSRVEMVVKGKHTIKVIQVAGPFLSSIKTFTYPGKTLQKGDKFGNISFSSQTVMVIPDELHLKVKEGMMVKGGSTVIAESPRLQKESTKG